MGGESKQTQTQASETQPWAPAQDALKGILGKLSGNLGGADLTGAETGALDTLKANASTASQFAPQITDFAKMLLGGGGATDQAGNVNANYQRYVDQTNPLASNLDYNPLNTPGFSDALTTKIADITNDTNGTFAAAGRDFSGANSMALGRGITAGIAPTIAAQFNANRDAQQTAAGNLYSGGNTTAGILAGMDQNKISNMAQGVSAASAANDATNASANATLAEEAQRRGIPVQALGLLAQIGIPIAGLGGTSTGTATTTKQASPLEQFMQLTQGIKNLMPTSAIKFG